MKVKTFSDGGARGNPGPAAIGYVIYTQSDRVLKQSGEYIGEGTNNHAEYTALIRALTAARDLGATEADCFLDSELVVKQLHGKYKVREQNLQQLIGEVFRLMKSFSRIEFTHVPREKNQLADKLVNEALDEVGPKKS
jgi:ribonuclease HI